MVLSTYYNQEKKCLKVSAGLLMYRLKSGAHEVFLVHPGGPLFANKDEGVWSIPKGEIEEGEDFLNAAIREFAEETGIRPKGEFFSLGTIKQKGGKTVHAWAFEGDRDEGEPIKSNTFKMEWPPHTGRKREFPEVDRGGFFAVEIAKQKINPAQVALIGRLQALLGVS